MNIVHIVKVAGANVGVFSDYDDAQFAAKKYASEDVVVEAWAVSDNEHGALRICPPSTGYGVGSLVLVEDYQFSGIFPVIAVNREGLKGIFVDVGEPRFFYHEEVKGVAQ